MNNKRRRASALMMKYYSGMIDEGSWKTAAGDIAVFNTKYRRDLKSLVVQLEPVQAGSGDPSPDNIRPISGRTGATVYQNNGKNYLDLKPFAEKYPQMCAYNDSTGELTLTLPGGILYTNGIDVDIPLYDLNGGYFSADIVCDAGLNFRFRFVRDDGTIVQSSGSQESSYTTIYTFPRTGRIKSIRFNWAGNPHSVTIKNAIMAPGQIAVPYTPYVGTAYPVSWETEAGTVYGAELDVVSGKLTVDRKLVNINDITSWYVNNGVLVSKFVPDAYNVGTNSGQIQNAAICSMLPNIGVAIIANMPDISMAQWDRTFRLKDSACETVEAYMTKYGDAQLCYYLAEPITYQLTPQQVQTLLGENVIWSDAGPVTVEYWS